VRTVQSFIYAMKDERIYIRVNDEEKKVMINLAESQGISTSDLIRGLLNQVREGVIVLEHGTVVNPYKELETVCRNKGIDVTEVIRNTTEGIKEL